MTVEGRGGRRIGRSLLHGHVGGYLGSSDVGGVGGSGGGGVRG